MPSASRRHLSAAGVAAVVAVTLSACGSSSDPPSTTSAAAADAARLKFAQCMRQHGVDMPDPGTGPPAKGERRQLFDRNDPTVQAAMKACQSQLPKAPGGGRGGFFVGPRGS